MMHTVALTIALALVQPTHSLEVMRRSAVRRPAGQPQLGAVPLRAVQQEAGMAATTPTVRAGTTSMMAAASSSAGGATVANSIINLSKNIVGSGVLALAAGIAAFSSAKIAVLPALGLMFVLCAMSAYTFSLIARVGDENNSDSYRGTWSKVFGDKLSIVPALTIAFKTYVGGLSYAIILGDSFASIATLAGAPALMTASNFWILLLSAFVLLPLSLLRDLSSLAVGSVIGTAGTLYTALFIWLRKLDASYAVGGKFYEAIGAAARPAFGAPTALFNPSMFVLVSMLSTTFLAHYNAPKYYNELAPPADGSSKQAAFNKVCAGAFGSAAVLCAAIMVGGFLTFGGASQGLILNSYATSDPLAFIARLGICASIIFSYPLIFVGLREGVLGLVGLTGQAGKSSVHVASTLLLLCATNGLALVLKNLGFVVSFGGALLGSALVYIFPALMFIQSTRQKAAALAKEGKSLPTGRKYEMYANYALAAVGAILAAVGCQQSLKGLGH